MRINYKILSLPPYISTSWKNVASLTVESRDGLPELIVVLLNGQRIEIPGLELPIIDAIFHAHAKFMDQELSRPDPRDLDAPQEQLSISFPLKIAMGDMVELQNLGSLLQHNPQQADTPPLPEEILNKIAFLSKTAGLDDPNVLPASEPDCNCMHCQISRAIHGETIESEPAVIEIEGIDDEVSDEELKFSSWNIVQTNDKLFTLTNPLDEKEKYNVFLGTPVGCTCGKESCEHILAVLRS